MRIIRFILGRIILFLDWATSPKPLSISQDEKIKIDAITSNMEIYEFRACPFCVRVRRFMKKNNISILTKDARKNKEYADELINGGGKLQVPCLYIKKEGDNPKWLYESKDIIVFLSKELGVKP
tara:strand:- start:573 stop:944 length:372 start_codon:yes stop_codon:yes gene_type:complete